MRNVNLRPHCWSELTSDKRKKNESASRVGASVHIKRSVLRSAFDVASTHSVSSPSLAAAAARPRAMHRRAAASCTQVRSAHRRALISSRSTPDDARRRAQASPTREGTTEVRRKIPRRRRNERRLTTRAVSFAHTRETYTPLTPESTRELFRTHHHPPPLPPPPPPPPSLSPPSPPPPPPSPLPRTATFLRHTHLVRACVRAYCSSLFFDLSDDGGRERKIDRADDRPFFFYEPR